MSERAKSTVTRLINHHSYGPDFTDVDHDTIANWFHNIGATRGYKGYSSSGHTYKGKNTFAQANGAGHMHNGKYCHFALMDSPWNQISWGAGNWEANKVAWNVEHCGNYLIKNFPDTGSRVMADFWRPQDKALGGRTYVNGHKDFSATACPARIYNAIPTMLKYINKKPADPVPPQPPVDPKDLTIKELEAEIASLKQEVQKKAELVSQLSERPTDEEYQKALDELEEAQERSQNLQYQLEEVKKQLLDLDQKYGWIEKVVTWLASIFNIIRR